jgi:hypothetical protein
MRLLEMRVKYELEGAGFTHRLKGTLPVTQRNNL